MLGEGKVIFVTPEGRQEIALEGEGPHAIVWRDGKVQVTTPEELGDLGYATGLGGAAVVGPSGTYKLHTTDSSGRTVLRTDGGLTLVGPGGQAGGAGQAAGLEEVGELLREMRAELRELRESVQGLREELRALRQDAGNRSGAGGYAR